MQILYVHKAIRKAWNLFGGGHEACVSQLSETAQQRLRGLKLWDELMAEGLSSALALHCVVQSYGDSRATWYRVRAQYIPSKPASLEPRSRRPKRMRQRQWDDRTVKRIITIRNHPDSCRWGKEKVVRQLSKEGIVCSASTVGRIITECRQKRTIVNYRPKKKMRRFRPRDHAQRRPKGFDPYATNAVQMDTDECRLMGRTLYRLTAVHLLTRYCFSRYYTRKTATCAKDFLNKLTTALPVDYSAIQVDGGSEFRGVFENACRDRNMPLFVLPPKSPKLNGAVERMNRTIQEEFQDTRVLPDTLETLNEDVLTYLDVYNIDRPHWSLNYYSPYEWASKHGMLTRSEVAFLPA